MGRWEKEAYEAVHSDFFWLTMDVSMAAKTGFDHLLHFLDTAKLKLKKKYGQRATHLSVLVNSKCDELAAEHLKQLDMPKWGDKPHEFFSGLVGGVGVAAAEFNLRIVQRVKSFPFLMVLLVEAEAHVFCPKRQAIAKRIVESPLRELDIATAKIRVLFILELVEAAETGELDLDCWNAIEEFKDECPTDMTLIESGNSVISRMGRPTTSTDHSSALVSRQRRTCRRTVARKR